MESIAYPFVQSASKIGLTCQASGCDSICPQVLLLILRYETYEQLSVSSVKAFHIIPARTSGFRQTPFRHPQQTCFDKDAQPVKIIRMIKAIRSDCLFTSIHWSSEVDAFNCFIKVIWAFMSSMCCCTNFFTAKISHVKHHAKSRSDIYLSPQISHFSIIISIDFSMLVLTRFLPLLLVMYHQAFQRFGIFPTG